MNTKRFEYFHKDIRQLKIDIVFRLLFCALLLGTFIWQITSMILISLNGSLSIMQGVVSSIVLLCSLLLCVVTMSYAFKDFRIISAIKTKGKCVSSVQILFRTDKKGFLWLYGLLMKFLALITTLVLIGSITYSILQVAYLSRISFYMPMLLMICVASYNAIYHIKDEITTQKTVYEQQPLY